MEPTLEGGAESTQRLGFQERLAELFREIERDMCDLMSGQITVKESRAKQREAGRRLKALEQELKLMRRVR